VVLRGRFVLKSATRHAGLAFCRVYALSWGDGAPQALASSVCVAIAARTMARPFDDVAGTMQTLD
jgi:hypothetical protein